MTTKIYIIGVDSPLYTSPCNSVGFIFAEPPHSLVHFSDGELRISYGGHHPLYIYEGQGMLFVYGQPTVNCGPLLAFWEPEKVKA